MYEPKKTYKALHAISLDGNRTEIGGLVELTEKQAAAFGADYVEEAKAENINYMSEETNTPETPAVAPEATTEENLPTGEQTTEPIPATEETNTPETPAV